MIQIWNSGHGQSVMNTTSHSALGPLQRFVPWKIIISRITSDGSHFEKKVTASATSPKDLSWQTLTLCPFPCLYYVTIPLNNSPIGSTTIPLSWCSHLEFLPLINVTKPRMEEQNSLVPICKITISIRYCYSIQGPRWRQHDNGLYIHHSTLEVPSFIICIEERTEWP